jgi:hypothetical protein
MCRLAPPAGVSRRRRRQSGPLVVDPHGPDVPVHSPPTGSARPVQRACAAVHVTDARNVRTRRARPSPSSAPPGRSPSGDAATTAIRCARPSATVLPARRPRSNSPRGVQHSASSGSTAGRDAPGTVRWSEPHVGQGSRPADDAVVRPNAKRRDGSAVRHHPARRRSHVGDLLLTLARKRLGPRISPRGPPTNPAPVSSPRHHHRP